MVVRISVIYYETPKSDRSNKLSSSNGPNVRNPSRTIDPSDFSVVWNPNVRISDVDCNVKNNLTIAQKGIFGCFSVFLNDSIITVNTVSVQNPDIQNQDLSKNRTLKRWFQVSENQTLVLD